MFDLLKDISRVSEDVQVSLLCGVFILASITADHPAQHGSRWLWGASLSLSACVPRSKV